MKVIGIDLAGVETKQTGYAILLGMATETKVLFSDAEITEEIANCKPSIVSIDAPLSRPLHGKTRCCEKQLMHMGIKVFPCMFAGMKKLTERGIRVAETVKRLGYEVIESYPGSAQDILNIPRKGRSVKALQKGLIRCGITGDVEKSGITNHELDAITSAIVGLMYLLGETISIGNRNEGLMVIPKRANHPTVTDSAFSKIYAKG